MKLNEIKNYEQEKISIIKSKLDKIPNGEILDLQETAGFLKIGTSVLRTYNKDLIPYTQKIKLNAHHTRVWGNPKTITELRKTRADLCR